MKNRFTAKPRDIWAAFFFSVVLSACDGSSSEKADPVVNPPDIGAASAQLEQGVLLDSVVVGARYDAGNGVTGNTDANGVFNFRSGNPVTFYLGELKLGTAMPVDRPAHLTELKADKVVTPLELAGENALLDDPATLNIARVLIAVDADADPANGIAVPSSVVLRSSGAGVVDYDNETSVVAAIRHLNNDVNEIGPIPNRADARQHLCVSLRSTQCAATTIPPIASSTDGATTTGSSTDGSTTTGSSTDGSITTGSSTDGSTTTGSSTDGSTTTGSSTDGSTTTGSSTDGSTTTGSSTDGSTTTGSSTDGTTTTGSSTDGTTTTGSSTDGSTTTSSSTDGSTTTGSSTDGSTTTGSSTDGSTTTGSSTDGSTTTGSSTDGTTADPTTPPNQSPYIAGLPQTEIMAGDSYVFTPEATDPDGDSLVFTIDGMPSWASFNASNGTLTGSPQEADVGSTSNVVISVSDGKAVAKLDTFSLRVSATNTPPVLTGEPNTQVNTGAEYRFTPVVVDKEGDALVYSVQALPAWALFDSTNGEITGIPDKTAVGVYEKIVVSVSDGKLSSSTGPFSINVILSNSAPEIVGTPVTTVAGKSEYLFTPVASDADSDPLVFTIEETPVWAVFDTATGALSGMPTNDQSGIYSGIVIAVSDGRETTQLAPFAIEVTYSNTAPVISGTPATWIQPGDSYSFTPVTVDNDPNTTLSYSAKDLPAWAKLDTASGTITGTPGVEALHQNIVLTVSDGVASDDLSFFVRVQSMQDFALTHGVASQGSQWSTLVANRAIDGDSNTSSHTGCVAVKNWWQVALPTEIEIHRLEITSTNNNLNRIAGASVFVSNSDYKDLPAEAAARETLVATGSPQVFTYDPPLKGSRVAVKATGSNCLHMSDVKVFGRAQDAPLLAAQLQFHLPAPVSTGDWTGKVDALDLQGDAVSYSLSGDNVPFAIDNDGNITVSGTIDHNQAQEFAFTVTASDSVNKSVASVRVGLLGRNGVGLERWTNIAGTQISALTDSPKYLMPADERGVISTMDVSGGSQNNYGLRLTSYLRPLVSGDYYFSIAGDDATALEISPTVDVDQARRVVERTGYSSYQGWSQSVESSPIRLQAGTTYFIRALLKEGSGGDHVSVGWRLASESTHSLIPANQLFREVLSAESVKPTFNSHQTTYLLGQATTPGSQVTTVTAADVQNDSLVYSITEGVPFSVDQSGAVTVSGPVTPATEYRFTVSATDGTHIINTELAVTTTVLNEVEHAIATGDAYVVSSVNLLEDEILATIDKAKTKYNDALIQILDLQADGSPKADGSSLTEISWNPTHDAALLGYKFGDNKVLLTTNSAFVAGYEAKQKNLAVLGETTARYIAMGGNPMRNYRRNNASINEQMHLFMENSLAWLSRRSDLKTSSFNVVIANVSDGNYFPDEQAVREWLDARFPGMASYNQRKACDDTALAGCITAATNLLIVSQHTDTAGNEQAVVDAVKSAMDQGIAVLYMHRDGGMSALGNLLFPLFNITHQHDNAYHRLGLNALNQSLYMNQLPDSISAVQTMMRNFQQQSFAIDWTDCDEKKPEKCSANASLNAQFWDGAWHVYNTLRNYDSTKINLFNHPEQYRLDKLLALLGDYYRRDVVFPMNAKTAPGVKFLRAFYADHAQYQYRDKVGVWTDLGNFSRTDFSHITPTSRTVNHTSKRNFRSTGAYALPGQTVTVTRNDNSAVNVKVFVNSLRAGSTHTFASNGYKRPRYLQAAAIPIASGETISFTSALGGPIQLSYDTNDLPVEVTFSNIGEQAYWRDTTDNDSFTAKLAAEEFDWAEVAAPSFEVHSKTEKMQQSVNDPVLLEGVGNTQALVDATMRYVHNAAHTLAGFKGPGIDVVPEIHQFAATNGLEIQNLDVVKHMNADQASCGSGCSGNPYDAYWSFSPLGHGDLHEMGHGLEKARFRLTGWPVHASTNFYSYYAKSQYFVNTGAEPNCQSLPFENTYYWIRNSFNAGATDKKAYLKMFLWNDPIDWSEGAVMIIQMMMSAQDNGALTNGWHLLARLHIIERAYQSAVNNDAKWLAARDGLGMGMFERAAAKAMSTEDWLVIAASHATGFDFRAYFDVWGHTYTAEASAQVAAMSFPSMPLNYYVTSAAGFCKGEGFDGLKLPLDGSSPAWTR